MDPHLLELLVLCACALVLYLGGERIYWATVVVIGVTALACASVRPQIQAARDDFVLACRKLTAAIAGDTAPSQVEQIAAKVCLAEQMGEAIEHEVAKTIGGSDLFAPDPPPDIAAPPAQP